MSGIGSSSYDEYDPTTGDPTYNDEVHLAELKGNPDDDKNWEESGEPSLGKDIEDGEIH